MPTGSALQFIQAYLSAQATEDCFSTKVFYPQHTQHGCPRGARAVAISVVQTRVTPASAAAASRDQRSGSGISTASAARGGDGTGGPVPGASGRVRAACAARGGSRRGGAALRAQPAPPAPVCPGAASRRAPLAARPPSLPPSLRPVRSRPQREGRETGSTLVPHVSRRAEVIMNDRHTFHNSCNAVVTQPAVVMP